MKEPTRTVRVLGIGAIVLVIALCVEALSFGYLRMMWKREPRIFAFDIEEHVATLPADQVEAYARAIETRAIYAPDPLLGWIRNPDSAHTFSEGITTTSDHLGARVSEQHSGTPLIAVYGDSFTEGVEVDDRETWEEQLGRLRNIRVLNFGVSGYGPDQALLLMERNLERGIGRTPVVILAMINENLGRLLNTYRSFYTFPYTDMILGFKPIFLERPGGFETKVFMPSNVLDRREVTAAIREASRFDPFFSARTEHLTFPYVVHAIGFFHRHGLHPRPPAEGATETMAVRMRHVLDRFLSAADRYRFLPVLVILPERNAEFAERAGHPHPLLDGIVSTPEYLGRLQVIDVVRLLSGPESEQYFPGFDVTRYIQNTHPSSYGCAAIASVVDRALGDVREVQETPFLDRLE